MPYKLATVGVMRTNDGAFIPPDIANMDWRNYQQWVSDGNVPLPKDPDPLPTQDEIDATTASIYVYFYDGGIQQNRIIDAIFLKNYNWKNWSASWSWRDYTAPADKTVGYGFVGDSIMHVNVTSSVDGNATGGHYVAEIEL